MTCMCAPKSELGGGIPRLVYFAHLRRLRLVRPLAAWSARTESRWMRKQALRLRGPWAAGASMRQIRRRSLTVLRRGAAAGSTQLQSLRRAAAGPGAGASCPRRSDAAQRIRPAQKEAAPGRYGSRLLRCGCDNCYWVGRISCENPMVLTERNDGVRGGRHAGPRVKLVSKV